MSRWSICLCAVLFAVACTSDGGPGTESPGGGAGGVGGVGGTGGDGDSGAGGESGGAGTAAGGSTGAGGVAGVVAGQGGGGGMGGQGGAGGDTAGADGGLPNDDDAGADDEGYCTVACTGVAPDEGVSEACGMITSSDECSLFETGGFPASCRWVTPDSEPCLAP